MPHTSPVSRIALALASAAGLAVAFTLVACSQSTAHPDPLGDCKSAYGCEPTLGAPADAGQRPATGGDGGTDAAATTDSGVKDAATD